MAEDIIDDPAQHQEALRTAAAIERRPDLVDPVLAGATGVAWLDRFTEVGPTEEAAELGVRLLAFAVDRAPDHPQAALWRYRSGTALAYLAEEKNSVADLDAALARMTEVAGDGSAPPDLNEWAAVDLASLTATRLAVAAQSDLTQNDLAQDEGLTPVDARRLTDTLAVMESVVLTEEGAVDYLLQRAHAHRWAYLCTSDPDDLDRVVSNLNTVLPELPPHDDTRADALEALAAVQEERFRLSADPALLDAAIAAAVEMRSLLPDGDPRLPWARIVRAGLVATRFWNAEEKSDADRDEAIVEYAALHAEMGLDDDYARDYGFLLCFRGGVTADAGDLKTGVDVLSGVSADPDWSLAATLAEAHGMLVGLDGTHHLWDTVDWSTRALAHDGPGVDEDLNIRTLRLDAVEAAAKEFGIGAVLARYDVRDMLADAESAARDASDASPQVPARLAVRAVTVRIQWLSDLYPFGDTEAIRASMRAQVDLLAKVRASLPPEDQTVIDGLTGLVDVTAHAFLGGQDNTPAVDPTRAGHAAGLERMIEILGAMPNHGPLSAEDEAESAVLELLQRFYQRLSASEDTRQLVGEFTALVWRVDALPPSDRRDDIQQALTTLSWAVGPPGTALPQERLTRHSDADSAGLVRLFAMEADWRAALADGDTLRALWAYQAVERAAAHFPPGTAQEMTARMVHGVCRAGLSAVAPTDPAAIDAAIADLDAIWRRMSGNPRPETVRTAAELGSRLRLRDRPGDRAASRDLSLAALAAEGRRMLLASTEDGLALAEGVGVICENLTAWCVDDGADDDLVRVLEARRGLVLGAACGRTADPDVVTGPGEVRATLRAVDADVLAYLVPECTAHSGMAVLVPVDGPVRVIPLPLLKTESLTKYSAAVAGYEAGAAAGRAWRVALTDLCGWAWEAAGRELVRVVGDARVVLVPLGALAVVPWAAAWRDVGGRRRYLAEDVEVSLAPSARLLGEVAARPPVTAGPAVFVGNPNRDDATAGVSAETLRDEFHPDGRFLGGHGQSPRPWRASEDGRGTPEEVRTAIAGGLSVLHLDCRAASDIAAPHRSRITLHDGAPLTASALLDTPADLGLVTLANHTTTGSVSSYDEASALPTAFLTLGARSVLAARWPASTAHLSYLIHHHIRENGCSPRTALRAAQLWMLDPDRTLPPNAPAHLAHPGPTDLGDIENWAALTHLGI